MRWFFLIAIGVTTQVTCVPADARTGPPTLDDLLALPLEHLVRLRIDPTATVMPAQPLMPVMPEKGGRHAP